MALTLDLSTPEGRADLRPATKTEKQSLIGLSRDELAEALLSLGVPERQTRMRVRQLWHWLYVRGVSDFSQMFNISKDLRAKLDAHFTIARPEIIEEQISKDGTCKWLSQQMTRAVHDHTAHQGPVFAKGKWLSYIDDDGQWENTIEYINRHPGVH